MLMKRVALLVMITFLLAACDQSSEDTSAVQATEPASPVTATAPARGSGMGMGMGPGSGMMARHHAPIPDEYAGLTNPVPASEESLARGAERYAEYCVNCHGTGGMGDGPAGQALDPQPAPIAHTSRMLGDDYLFWRISEGGLHEPFLSAMPRWQDVLGEEERWDVVNYVRALGSGQVMPGGQAGGAAFDPAAEAAQHEQMAAQGVEQGLFTQQEADTFLAVHAQLDELVAQGFERQGGGMDTMQQRMLSGLLDQGRISEAEAETFNLVHNELLEAGLME